MGLRSVVASKSGLVLGVGLAGVLATLSGPRGADSAAPRTEDERLLQSVRLPRDPKRTPAEDYGDRVVIRTRQGRTFIGAYWREGGSALVLKLDIFSLRTERTRPVAKRILSVAVGAAVESLEVRDFDGDGRDDILLLTDTGGSGAGSGVVVLRQTRRGFSEVFWYAGRRASFDWAGGRLRILVESIVGEKAEDLRRVVEEFGWNRAKSKFELIRTTDLTK